MEFLEIREVKSLSRVSRSPFYSLGRSISQPSSLVIKERPSIFQPTLATKGFADVVSKDLLDSLSSEERQRQEVIYELLNTEKQYVEDLHTILEVFVVPLRERELLNKQELGSVFGNIEVIVPVHETILAKLEDLQKENPVIHKVAEHFLETFDLLKHYAIYCSNQPTVVSKIKQLCKAKNEFSHFMENVKANGRLRKLGLDSFLIKPMQRICKYPLLFREIVKSTPESHPEYASLLSLKEKMDALVDSINERTRRVQQVQKLADIQETLDGTDGFQLLDEYSRMLIREGPCKFVSKSIIKTEIYLFLFNDMLLVTKPGKKGNAPRYQVYWRVSHDHLVLSPSPQESSDTFDIYNSEKERIYTLQFSDKEEKEQWLEDLQKFVKIKQRSMSVSAPTSPMKGFSSFSLTASDKRKMQFLEKQMIDNAQIQIETLANEINQLKTRNEKLEIEKAEIKRAGSTETLSPLPHHTEPDRNLEDMKKLSVELQNQIKALSEQLLQSKLETTAQKETNANLQNDLQDQLKIVNSQRDQLLEKDVKIRKMEADLQLSQEQTVKLTQEKEKLAQEVQELKSTLMFYVVANNGGEFE